MERVYLGFGTNLGDRCRNLRAGLACLADEVAELRLSAVYETAPVGVRSQPWFMNLVATGLTALGPVELLTFLKDVERRVGRVPTYRWGPRVLDIDILLFGARSVDEPDLTVPHPRLRERAFVLIPLAELAPEVRLPDGSSLSQLIADLSGDPIVRRLGDIDDVCSA